MSMFAILLLLLCFQFSVKRDLFFVFFQDAHTIRPVLCVNTLATEYQMLKLILLNLVKDIFTAWQKLI